MLDPDRIRWIAFDAVGTLLKVSAPVASVYAQVARRYGSRLTEQEIAVRFPRVFAAVECGDCREADWTDPRQLTTNEEHERQRWRTIVASVLDDVEEMALSFEALFSHFADPAAWLCYPDVADTLRWCAAAGYRLAVASNFDTRLHRLCNILPELHPIELRVISSELGYRKPSLHFYRGLAERAGCSPDRILMVGDDRVNDVEGARQAGLNALLLDRRGEGGELSSLSDLPRRLE